MVIKKKHTNLLAALRDVGNWCGNNKMRRKTRENTERVKQATFNPELLLETECLGKEKCAAFYRPFIALPIERYDTGPVMSFTCHQQLLWSGLTFFWGFDHAVFEKHIGSSCKPHDWDLCMNISALFKAVTCLFEQRWTSGHQGLYIKWNIFWQQFMTHSGLKSTWNHKHPFLTYTGHLVADDL